MSRYNGVVWHATATKHAVYRDAVGAIARTTSHAGKYREV